MGMSAALNTVPKMIHTHHRMQRVLLNLSVCCVMCKLAAPAGHPFNIASFQNNITSDYCFKYRHISLRTRFQMYKMED